MGQAKRNHPFLDVDQALMLAKGHRIQQGFDGAHPMGGAGFGLEEQRSSSRTCRHDHEVGLNVTPVLKMDAAVLNGDDLGVGFDGHAHFVEGSKDPPNEVRPPGMEEQALAHVQRFSTGAKVTMNGRKPPPRQEASGLDGRFIGA